MNGADPEHSEDDADGAVVTASHAHYKWNLDGSGKESDVRVRFVLELFKTYKEEKLKSKERDMKMTQTCNAHPVFATVDPLRPDVLINASFEGDAPTQKAKYAIAQFKKKFKQGAVNNEKGDFTPVQELCHWHMVYDENEKSKKKATKDMTEQQKAHLEEIGLHLGMVDAPNQESNFTGKASL